MARRGRPASESYQPVSYSGSQSLACSSDAGMVGLEDEDEQAPIFSLSKSSMDVMTGPLHKRDPAWTRMDLKRSSSTNTHSEPNAALLQHQRPHLWQRIHSTNSQQSAGVPSPPAFSERLIAMQRWSECSGSTISRSSTPETIIWRDGTSSPSSLTKETPCSALPDSPMSRPTSPSTSHSSFNSPLQTPDQTRSLQDFLNSELAQSTDQQEDPPVFSPTHSPLQSPLQPGNSSPLPSSSSTLTALPTGTEDEGFLENNLHCFTFPTPIASSVSLADGAVSSDPECLVVNIEKDLHSPEVTQLLEGEVDRSPVEMLSKLACNSSRGGQESVRGDSVCHELPWDSRVWRTPLVCSLSDSQLVDSCRCSMSTRVDFIKAPQCEEGTMTSQPQLVDAAVQTVTPIGSLWGLFRNNSPYNTGSHSFLGSPPGSRLNLKSSMGSHSNLVSPSSSMFPVSSGEDEETPGEDLEWGVLHDPERRRSCLKSHGEKHQQGRRSSMKQVQWDKDGMTWDIHGASMDSQVLSIAIRKQLELQNSPQPQKKLSSSKKKAPKPPLLTNVVKALAPELNPPVMIITSTCTVEGETKEKVDGDRLMEVGGEGRGKMEETVEVPRKLSRAEGGYVKEIEEEVYRRDAGSQPMSPARGSVQIRKKSVIRSLKRPGWCGSSRTVDD